MTLVRLGAIAALALHLALASALADSQDDRARKAVESGEVKPLKAILKAVRSEVEGEVLDAELTDDGGAWTYRVRVLAPDGRVVDVGVDGASGRIVTIDGGG